MLCIACKFAARTALGVLGALIACGSLPVSAGVLLTVSGSVTNSPTGFDDLPAQGDPVTAYFFFDDVPAGNYVPLSSVTAFSSGLDFRVEIGSGVYGADDAAFSIQGAVPGPNDTILASAGVQDLSGPGLITSNGAFDFVVDEFIEVGTPFAFTPVDTVTGYDPEELAVAIDSALVIGPGPATIAFRDSVGVLATVEISFTAADDLDLNASVVPEPATLTLMGLGFGLLTRRRRKDAI